MSQNSKIRVAAVIPARMASTRFPAKPLALLAGKPIIQWVWERVVKSKADEAVVATDDVRIADAVRSFGGRAVMTSPNHPSGSDRVWEAARDLNCGIIVNVQGDEPFVRPDVIDTLADFLKNDPEADMATAGVPAKREEISSNPNIVKIVLSNRGNALYFSRSAVPFLRTGGTDLPLYRHWGIYAYRYESLKKFVSLPESPLEKCEKLEQLRALEAGMCIKVAVTEFQSIGIDTPEDLAEAEKFVAEHGL